MKLKYKLPIVIILALITLTLTLSTSYGIYLSLNDNNDYYTKQIDCITIMYESETINSIVNISSDEFGNLTDPFTVSIENTCQEEQEVEIRLNLLDDNIKESDLKISINGNLEVNPTLYSSLINSANKEETSKIISTVTIEPNDIFRFNLRTWLTTNADYANGDKINARLEITTNKTFIKPTFKETILDANNLNSINDDGGLSYYFEGDTTTNYVTFANQLWRIVRINGDGSIRLILENPLEATSFNASAYNSKYTGYEINSEEEITSSTIKLFLDNWYDTNLKTFDRYLTKGSYCNDITPLETIDQYGADYYQSYQRVKDNKPSLKCDSNNYSIGLLSVDEAMLAIGNYQNHYLNINKAFYTSSPSKYSNAAYMYIVNIYGQINELPVNNQLVVKPVINLNNENTVTGNGTIDKPYTVDIKE